MIEEAYFGKDSNGKNGSGKNSMSSITKAYGIGRMESPSSEIDWTKQKEIISQQLTRQSTAVVENTSGFHSQPAGHTHFRNSSPFSPNSNGRPNYGNSGHVFRKSSPHPLPLGFNADNIHNNENSTTHQQAQSSPSGSRPALDYYHNNATYPNMVRNSSGGKSNNYFSKTTQHNNVLPEPHSNEYFAAQLARRYLTENQQVMTPMSADHHIDYYRSSKGMLSKKPNSKEALLDNMKGRSISHDDVSRFQNTNNSMNNSGNSITNINISNHYTVYSGNSPHHASFPHSSFKGGDKNNFLGQNVTPKGNSMQQSPGFNGQNYENYGFLSHNGGNGVVYENSGDDPRNVICLIIETMPN